MLVLKGIDHLVPYYWGNQDIVKKINFLKEYPSQYNTLVIGSSVIYRHFIPSEFDAITETTSFNLGSPGMSFLESAYLLEHCLESDVCSNMDNILILAHANMDRSKRNAETLRANYFMDFRRLRAGIECKASNWEQLGLYLKAYLNNLFYVGRLGEMITYHSYRKQEELEPITRAQHGFLALDDDLPHQWRSPYFKRTNKNKDIKGIDKQFSVEGNPLKLNKKDQFLLKDLTRLKDLCQQKGIQLYFVILSNNSFAYKVKLDNILYLGDGVDFPAYFKADNRFDAGHLNKKGATLFSRRIGHLFVNAQ